MAKILVIDDNFLVRDVTAELLLDEGHIVVTASNGAEGLRGAKVFSPDLIITDILMPEIDGLELIRTLRAQGVLIPILAMSGGGKISAQWTLDTAIALGAAAFLPKPFSAEQLLRAVKDNVGELRSKEDPSIRQTNENATTSRHRRA